jgi:hypothetical protein
VVDGFEITIEDRPERRKRVFRFARPVILLLELGSRLVERLVPTDLDLPGELVVRRAREFPYVAEVFLEVGEIVSRQRGQFLTVLGGPFAQREVALDE